MKAAFSFETIFLVLEIVMLIFFGVIMIRMLGAFLNPDLQTALLNTEVLKSKINEACITGQAQMDGFRLTQPAPSKSFTAISTGFAKFAIQTSGDPHYVLYYEAFPYGEAEGWEALQSFDNRILTYYKYPDDDADGFSIGVNEFENDLWRSPEDMFITRVDNLVVEKLSTDEGEEILKNHPEILAYKRTILVTNIELTEQLGAIPAYSVYNAPADENGGSSAGGSGSADVSLEYNPNPEERIRSITESFGAWNEDRTFFKFSNYRGMSDMEQSFVKYRPCGDNSLCLKTREGVYKFQLADECKNIKYIALYYDETAEKWKVYVGAAGIVVVGVVGVGLLGAGATVGTIGAGVASVGKVILRIVGAVAGKVTRFVGIGGLAGYALGKATAWILGIYLSYKRSDMYFASPCDIEGRLEITKVSCSSLEPQCERIIRYPIYSYSGDTVTKKGEHISCLVNVGDDFKTNYEELSSLNGLRDEDCLQIRVHEKPKDFCWTPNPWPPTWNVGPLNTGSDTRDFASISGALPIKDNTLYIGSVNEHIDTVLVKKFGTKGDTNTKGFAKRLLANVLDIDWVWPAGFVTTQK